MKYRIIKRYDSYYPQFKWLCFWMHFERGLTESNLYFDTLEQAEMFIEDVKRADQPPIVVREY